MFFGFYQIIRKHGTLVTVLTVILVIFAYGDMSNIPDSLKVFSPSYEPYPNYPCRYSEVDRPTEGVI